MCQICKKNTTKTAVHKIKPTKEVVVENIITNQMFPISRFYCDENYTSTQNIVTHEQNEEKRKKHRARLQDYLVQKAVKKICLSNLPDLSSKVLRNLFTKMHITIHCKNV